MFPALALGDEAKISVASRVSLTRSKTSPYYVCPPKAGVEVRCDAVAVPAGVSGSFEGSGEGGGYDPADLKSAYNLPESGGTDETVAITELDSDPKANADLKQYRKHYGLPECTEESGCLRIVNGKGESGNLPPSDEKWAAEASVDLDMVSAACPGCHILLVEAGNALGSEAVRTAIKLGATVVSNSWGNGPENALEHGEGPADEDYDYPGIPILFSSGDYGYDNHLQCLEEPEHPRECGRAPTYPATSPDVVAVGGTKLTKVANTRGWEETVWQETGSGCSAYEPKPTWQTDSGCAERMTNDVAAVAAPGTPVSVYDSYEDENEPWQLFGGTSVATPIVAGILSLASHATQALGAEAFYKESPSLRFDVTSGGNNLGEEPAPCPFAYFCNGEVGYSGPTGVGTPDGVPNAEVGAAVRTDAASSVGASGATLQGAVDPKGRPTRYYFEYGTTRLYGSKTAEENAGSGTSNAEEYGSVRGLVVNTTYHYRIVATNSEATTYGIDQTLTTTTRPSWSLWLGVPEKEGALEAGSCAVGECVAAGNGIQTRPLAERWDGTAWESIPMQKPFEGEVGYHFAAASCSGSHACTVVGAGSPRLEPIAERMSETEWLAQTPVVPSKAFSGFTDVSCPSQNSCTAVGEEGDPRALFGEHWNGAEWALDTIPIPAKANQSALYGVACLTESECAAVGDYYDEKQGKYHPLVERLKAGEWKSEVAVTPKGAVGVILYGVSCPATNSCIAVGLYWTTTKDGVSVNLPLAESWNGVKWAVMTTPSPEKAPSSFLRHIACVNSGNCTVIGGEIEGADPFIEHWNGTEWALQSIPMPPAEPAETSLDAISSVGEDEYIALGSYRPSNHPGEEIGRITTFGEIYH
jgi:hypothetical protein